MIGNCIMLNMGIVIAAAVVAVVDLIVVVV